MSEEFQQREDSARSHEEETHPQGMDEVRKPHEAFEDTEHGLEEGTHRPDATESAATDAAAERATGDSITTPRFEDRSHDDPSRAATGDTDDYFTIRRSLKHSSSGFLASLSASQRSSPLHSNSVSTASLRSSQAGYGHGDDHVANAASRILQREEHSSSGSLHSMARSATSSQSSQTIANIAAERPRYPDQSHAALHNQTTTLPYHFLKSRASDYGHPQPVSVSPSCSIDRVTASSSVSRSADQTPLGSPGLFQLPRKSQGSGSDRSSPSYLHPTQLHIPKETYKLIKDFDSTTGNKIMNNYEVLEKLGMGSHGAVKRARNLVTDEDVAIKIVRRYGKKGRLGKQESPEDKVKKEVAVLKKARHPHVVSLLEVIDDPEFGKVYIVLEFVKKGEIIWRTEGNKDIADFEMNRYKREMADAVEPEVEIELLSKLNAKLLAMEWATKQSVSGSSDGESRAHQSIDSRLLLNKFSDEHLDLHRYITTDHPDSYGNAESQAAGGKSDWSIESGGYEDDTDTERRRTRQLRRRRSIHKDAEEHETMWQTQRALQPRSEPRLDSQPLNTLSASLIGSQYGPYDHDSVAQGSSVIDFRDILSAASSQPQWTSEEDAFRYVPCLTMSQARDVFRDTVLGLEYLHFQGIIHRDIKPANLLWTSDYRVKISDFGVSYIGRPIREKDDEQEEPAAGLDEEFELAKTVGTPAFYAPELCDPDLFNTEKTPVRPQITGQIDVWALGVTLYCMIFGRLPFSGENQFEMFEKIAWEDPYISSKRLRGVEEDGKMPMNSNKRLPYHVEYEEVDDLLKDLIRRLLHKDPNRRITLKEVKHHPWVVKDLKDPAAWIENTDPSLQSKGKKIEVSTNDIITAVAPLNLVDRIKHQFSSSIKRLGSVVGRGRDSRRRAESNVKDPSLSGGSASSRASTVDREGRRPSLRGDEQIYSALRASRETGEHPLSQSLVASPVADRTENPFFVHPVSHVDYPSVSTLGSPAVANYRPFPVDRTDSTTESIRTIRASAGTDTVRASTPPTITEDADWRAPSDSAASSSTGLSSILGLASRKLASSMQRSRERIHLSRENSSVSSRSSSYEHMASSFEEAHSFPSVGFSPAVALGHVDHQLLEPIDTRAPQQPANLSRPMAESSPMAFQKAQEQNMRKMMMEHEESVETVSRPQSRGTPSSKGECPLSPDDVVVPVPHDGREPLESAVVLGSVSSDDQFALSESFSSPSIPSTSTSTSHDPRSSMLATADTIKPENYNEERRKSLGFAAAYNVQASNQEEDDAGYNGDGDGDESDEDEGLMMMGGRR